MVEVRRRLRGLRTWITRKLWMGRDPDETLAKHFKIFVVIAITLAGVSKLIYLSGTTIPNIELIIPTLVVIGVFTPLYAGPSEAWTKVNKYFGLLILPLIFIIDLLFWGFDKIYLFTWSGFALIWVTAAKKDLSFFDKFSDLAFEATVTAAAAILFFDIFTAFGTWLLWRSLTLTTLYEVYMLQIPFTLYHLASLIFVPPLVWFGKKISRVKVRVPASEKVQAKESTGT